MLEKTIEEILKRFHHEVWPELELTFVENQRRLPSGKIIDLCFADPEGTVLIVEVKRGRVIPKDAEQLRDYLVELRNLYTETQFRGMLVAPNVPSSVREMPQYKDLDFCQVEIELLRSIASRHSMPIDHATDHRPKLSGSSKVKSRPPVIGQTSNSMSLDTVDFLRHLDAKFPPGSLNHLTSQEEIENYWCMACPRADNSIREIAVEITMLVLAELPDSAMSNRTEGKSEKYTTIRTLDGRVAAAIDARSRAVKLDFPLPEDVARECEASGELRVWAPRGHSLWVLSKVGTKISTDRAKELLKIGIGFEFHGKVEGSKSTDSDLVFQHPVEINASNSSDHTPPITVEKTQHPPSPASNSETISYWKSTCPSAPMEIIVLAAEISKFIFDTVPNASFSKRSIGKVESYTPIRTPDNVVIAALDARSTFLKLDFLLPSDVADDCNVRGEMGKGKPRRKGRWVLTRVGKKITVDRAKELLLAGLRFEDRV